jgi:hypothetical protein
MVTKDKPGARIGNGGPHSQTTRQKWIKFEGDNARNGEMVVHELMPRMDMFSKPFLS